MPLLQEVREVLQVHTNKPAKNFNHVVKKFYPVHEDLEKGFMSDRDVPQTVITEVHLGNLIHVGASSATAHLNKATCAMVQEEATLNQTQYAVSSLRLVNSNCNNSLNSRCC